jgi:Glycosyltransferase family 87
VGGRSQPWASLAALLLVYAWFWVVSSHRVYGVPFEGFAHTFVTGCGDFEHFYRGAKAMREGTDPYAAGVRGYIYPPLIAFLFMPLTFLSVQTAAVVMLGLNMALALMCTLIACQEALRRFDLDHSFSGLLTVMAVTTVLAAPRLRSELQMWQTNLLMLAAVLLALRWLDRRPRWAGLMLGLAVNIKYLPLIYLPYLLLRRRYTAAVWFGVGILGFALLPALHTGWTANKEQWATAASGIAQLFGVKLQATAPVKAANIDALTVGHSMSITSGMARIVAAEAAPALKWWLTAAVGVAALAALAFVYRRFNLPLFLWPRAPAQNATPYRSVVALEWGALMALALAFSPQTNPRHLVLLLMVFALLAALLCASPTATSKGASRQTSSASRRLALAALVIMMAGLSLPPGTPEFAAQLAWWRKVGGPGWSLVVMLPLLLAAGFTRINKS